MMMLLVQYETDEGPVLPWRCYCFAETGKGPIAAGLLCVSVHRRFKMLSSLIITWSAFSEIFPIVTPKVIYEPEEWDVFHEFRV